MISLSAIYYSIDLEKGFFWYLSLKSLQPSVPNRDISRSKVFAQERLSTLFPKAKIPLKTK